MTKRILIIGQNFNDGTGGGVTLSNLFSGFNCNEIALATTYDLYNDDDLKYASSVYLLGNKEYRVKFPFNLVQKTLKSKIVEGIKEEHVSVRTYNKMFQYLFSGFLDFMRFLGLYSYLRNMFVSQVFLDWYDSIKPDLVYTQLGSVYMLNFINELIVYRKPELAIHIMDDWAKSLAGRMFYKKIIYKSIDSKFRNIIQHSNKRICISDAMAKEYSSRYGGQWRTFHNAIDTQLKRHMTRKLPNKEDFKIMYFGRIGLANKKSLKIFIEAIEAIEKNFSFHIYTPDTRSFRYYLRRCKKTHIYQAVSHEQAQLLMVEADLLFLPLDFSNESVDFIKLSMPTKMPEYMSSGTPIFILAPKECALVDYAKKYKAAFTCTVNQKIKITEDLSFVYDNYSISMQYAERSLNIVEENHNILDQSLRFRDLIVGA